MLRPIVGTIAVSIFLVACSDKPLTGPDAQAAFVRVRDHSRLNLVVGEGMVLLLDGRVVTSRDRVAQLDPKAIHSIEIVKGPAARKLYGDAARNGAIHISTQASPAPEPTN